MELLIFFVICFYILSSAGYYVYFFNQEEYLYKTGYYLLLTGFVFHTILICWGYIKFGHIPARNLYETLSLAGWSIAGVFLVLRYKFNLKILGVFAAPFAAVVVLTAAIVFPDVPPEAQPLFKSLWLSLHLITIFLGEASLALACGTGIMYLIQENAIKTKKHGMLYKRLPSLDLLDNTGYFCIVAGFSMLTIGLITGLIYAKHVWGRFWSWDPKEIWSMISWLVYAALIHERVVVGWRGRRAAIMAIIGFLFLLFTFFGINFFLEGHHGEFTRV